MRLRLMVAVGLTACSVNLKLPEKSVATCRGDADCPQGYECSAVTTICVSTARADKQAPGIQAAQATPPVIGRNGSSVITFTATETLAQLPIVQGLVADDTGDGHYSVTLRATGDEVPNTPVPITAKLVDLAGNGELTALVTTLTYDFTPPTIGDATASGTGSSASPILVEFTLGTASDSVVLVDVLENDVVLVDTHEVQPPQFRFRYDPTGSESEGRFSVRIKARDEVGNETVSIVPGLFSLDLSPPVVGSVGAFLLTPPPGSPLTYVPKVTNGSYVRINLSFNEALQGDPVVSFGTVTMPLTSHLGDIYQFDALVTGLASGTYPVFVDATDQAQNAGRTTLTQQIIVDVDVPTAPTDTLLQRQPFGPPSTVTLSGHSSEPDSYVIARSASALELSRTLTGADGAFSLPLGDEDRAHVFIVVVDAAGNVSPQVEVKAGEYIANSGTGVTPNPHRYEAVGRFQGSLAQRDATLFGANLVYDEGLLATASSIGVGWRKPGSVGPQGRNNHVFVHDPRRGVTVMFGGSTRESVAESPPDCAEGAGIYCGYTWEWDGDAWSLASTTGPSPRRGARAVYDTERGMVVVFGGEHAADCQEGTGNYCAWTWGWDGETWHVLATIGPPGRVDFGMAYDNDRHVTVLHGGRNVYGNCAEPSGSVCAGHWEFVDDTWTLLSTMALTARERHTLVYDEANHQTITFGGFNGSDAECTAGAPCNRARGLVAGAWSLLGAATASGRLETALAWHPTQGKLWMFGGQNFAGCGEGASSYCQSTWRYGAGWEGYLTGNPPGSRRSAGMAYDVANDAMVLFGGVHDTTCGENAGTNCDWVWRANGSNDWRVAPRVATSPSADSSVALAVDNNSTPYAYVGNNVAAVLYRLSATGWGYVTTATGVAGQDGARMALDEASSKLILFGGAVGGPPSYPSTTWRFSGGNWNSAPSVGAAGRIGHHVINAGTHGLLLWGGLKPGGTCDFGVYCKTLWRWDDGAGDWVSVSTNLPGRAFAAAAYDPGDGADPLDDSLLIFGGELDPPNPVPLTYYTETWRYVFATDTASLVTSTGPVGSQRASMAFDANRRVMVMLEGRAPPPAGNAPLTGTWVWQGTEWVRDTNADLPARLDAGLVYVPTLESLLAYGGKRDDGSGTSTAPINDTWLRGGAATQPGEVFTVDWASAAVAERSAVTSIVVSWTAGATASGGDGVTLLAWEGDRWTLVGTDPASANTRATLSFTISDPARLARILGGQQPKIAFAIRPTSAGTSATVKADSVKVVVHYTRP